MNTLSKDVTSVTAMGHLMPVMVDGTRYLAQKVQTEEDGASIFLADGRVLHATSWEILPGTLLKLSPGDDNA